MSDKRNIIGTVVGLMTDKSVQKVIFGEYSDGSPRSLMDCLDGEILSPSDRERFVYGKKKKKKKHKKKKPGKIDL